MSAETTLSPAEISAYYRERVPDLKQHGHEWRGLCPVHGGTDDNFSVNADTGDWFCHSQCQRGGDAYSLEAELTGVTEFPRIRAEVERIVGRVEAAPESRRQIKATYNYPTMEYLPEAEIARQGIPLEPNSLLWAAPVAVS